MSKNYPEHQFSGQARLDVQDLSCERGYHTLFDNLSFSLESGETAQVTGPNGVGKTTLIRALAGVHQPATGRIQWNHQDIQDPDCEYASQIGYLGHKLGLRGDMSAMENLEFYRGLLPGNSGLSAARCLEILAADGYAHRPCNQLSSGQRQRVAISRLCLHLTRLWFLDEPATALDIEGIEMLENLLKCHLDNGGILLYSSHQPLSIVANARIDISLQAA